MKRNHNAALPFNGRIERRPQFVARCKSEADVIEALIHARKEGLDLSIRGGGHNVSGVAYQGNFQVDLSAYRKVSIDEKNEIATVQGGATYVEFDEATNSSGFWSTGGAYSSTGVVGLNLGGGAGWLMGEHGLACDNILAARLVLADGSIMHVDDKKDSAIMRLIRGGGEVPFVVSELEIRLHKMKLVQAGSIFFHPSVAPELLSWVQANEPNIPNALTMSPCYFHIDGQLVFSIDLLHLSSCAESTAFLSEMLRNFDSLSSDLSDRAYADWQRQFDNLDRLGRRSAWRSAFLIDAAMTDFELIHNYMCQNPNKMAIAFLEHLHGEVCHPQKPTSWNERPSCFQILITANWKHSEEDSDQLKWIESFRSALETRFGTVSNVNYMDMNELNRPECYPFNKNTWDSNLQLMSHLDPNNVFKNCRYV